MNTPRPIIVVHTRASARKDDEWFLWGLGDDSWVALFHLGGCVSGRIHDAVALQEACAAAGLAGPDSIDVCVTRGREPDEVWIAMQAMIDNSAGRPIYVAIHDINGIDETKLQAEVHLELAGKDRRGVSVYSIGEGNTAAEHLAVIKEYTTAARGGLLGYEAALERLKRFLLADLIGPN